MKEGENGTKCRFMALHLRRVIARLARINMCWRARARRLQRSESKQDAETHPGTAGTHTRAADRKLRLTTCHIGIFTGEITVETRALL